MIPLLYTALLSLMLLSTCNSHCCTNRWDFPSYTYYSNRMSVSSGDKITLTEINGKLDLSSMYCLTYFYPAYQQRAY